MSLNNKKNKNDTLDFENLPEFDDHNLVVFLRDEKSGLNGFVAIHRGGNKFPAFGATRLWDYESRTDALRDALRLSRMMSYKNASAGIKYGGGKAALIMPKGKFSKVKLLKAYTEELNRLGGKFITGTDVGLSQDDLTKMMKTTKYLVGSKRNPEYSTAVGLFYSLQAAFKQTFGNESIEGHTFAIQGVGKVGGELLKLIYKDAKQIYVADINKATLAKVKKQFPNVEVVDTKKIHMQKVDVFVPCALSRALNSKTIPKLKCKIVVGSANNQLENSQAAIDLHKRGILYCPDYVVNAGGLIAVVDEYEHNGTMDAKRLEDRIFGIKARLTKILKESKKKNVSPHVVADNLALKILKKNGR